MMNKKYCLIFFLLATIICNSQQNQGINSNDSSLTNLHKSGGNPNPKNNTGGVGGYGSIPPQQGNNPPIKAGDDNTRMLGTPNKFYFMNENDVTGKNISKYYTEQDTSGNIFYYASYDNSSELVKFKTLGLSIILLIFSIYLFHISTKIYRQYFDKKATENYFTQIFYLCVVLLNFFWILIVLANKKK